MRVSLQISILMANVISASSSYNKDSNSYGGYSNPNTAYSHYWADSKNVLADLSSFKELWVRYHNCAWSPITYTGSNNNNNNKNNGHRDLGGNNNNNNNNQCGSDAGSGGEDNWFLGMGQCVGANVAFTLYGVLPDDYIGKKESPCSKKTYINSFFTTNGLYSFAKATEGDVDISAAPQYCGYYSNDYYYSMTTGCSSSGKFTVDTFYGKGCIGAFYNYTIDTLDQMNANLTSSMECTQIYASDGSAYDYATELLTYSSSCLPYGNNKYFCPDPYYMLKTYEYNYVMAQMNSSYFPSDIKSSEEEAITNRLMASLLFIVAGVLLLASVIMRKNRDEREDVTEFKLKRRRVIS